jgi:hypothetical protein
MDRAEVRYVRANNPSRCWAHSALIAGLDGLKNLIGSFNPLTKFVWWIMKTGEPTGYPPMPFQLRQLGPAPYGVDAQFMMDNFDVPLDRIEMAYIALDPLCLIISEKEMRVKVAGAWEQELNKIHQDEQMSLSAGLMVLDEREWQKTGARVQFRRRTKAIESVAEGEPMQLDDIEEEESEEEGTNRDWSEERVNQVRDEIGPTLKALGARNSL